MSSSSPSLSDSRSRLAALFAPSSTSTSTSPSTHPSKWESLWADGSFLPWDRSAPNPAFVDLLSQRADLVGSALRAPGETPPPLEAKEEERKGGRKRRKALVPGCGRGYDVYLLASRGWDVVGWEVSASAAEGARKKGEGERKGEGREGGKEEGKEGGKEGYGPNAYAGIEGVYDILDPEGMGEGKASFEVADFLKAEKEKEKKGEGGWDLIYDYTFLSALPPSLRPRWALQMSKLLSPTGRLVCIEFPTYKDPASGGPPWALPSEVYEGHLSRPGVEIPYEEGRIVLDRGGLVGGSEGGLEGLERVAHFQPERTFEVGRGTDWVSVWRKKGGDGG